jgi:hypothetical protein
MMQSRLNLPTRRGFSMLGCCLVILAVLASVVLSGCGDGGERYTPPPATIIRSSDEAEPTATAVPAQVPPATQAAAAPTAIPPTPAPEPSTYPYPYSGQLPGGAPLPTQAPVVYPSPTQ